jgi:sec-independent protein translocase protein TatA
MGSMSIVHWLIVLFVVVLMFGPRRLPELAKGMGEAIREFKKAVNAPETQQKPQLTGDQQSSTPKNEQA